MSRLMAGLLVVASIAAAVAVAQVSQPSEVIAEFDDSAMEWRFEERDVLKFERQGVAVAEAESVLDTIQRYQAGRDEGLGLELTRDLSGAVLLTPRADLRRNQIAIGDAVVGLVGKSWSAPLTVDAGPDAAALPSSSAQKILQAAAGAGVKPFGDYGFLAVPSGTGAITLRPAPDLRPGDFVADPTLLDRMKDLLARPDVRIEIEGPALDISDVLQGQGANSRSLLGIGADTQKTTDPVGGQPAQVQIDNIARLCANGGCNSGGLAVDPNEYRIAKTSDDSAPVDLQACDKAREEYRKSIERNGRAQTAGADLSFIPGGKAIAAEFDRSCLTRATGIPDKVLERFAVLRLPSDPYPFCGAYRIGSTQFITSMHCFQDSDGSPFEARIQGVQIFTYLKPTTAIAVDAQRRPRIEDRSSLQVAYRRQPAMRDYVVLTTLPFDNASATDFPDVLGVPRLGAPALLPGYFLYHEASPSLTGFTNTWADGVRATNKAGDAYCRVYDGASASAGGGCLIHRCQSMPLFSGSPILQAGSDRSYRIIGVHSGGAAQPEQHCPKQFSAGRAAGDATRPIVNDGSFAALVEEKMLLAAGWLRGE
jgi:hypothetical protein